MLAVSAASCERGEPAAPLAGSGDNEQALTVVSLVPAATDLIIGMGAADQLVAVSNYDVPREPIADLPRVGDYQNVDWEQIRRLQPRVMIIFQDPDRVPPGMRQQANSLRMQLVNVRTETLEDLFRELEHLGDALGQREKAAVAAGELRGRIDAVRQRVEGRPRVRTLIVRDEKAQGVVGRGNFLNDLLEIAGGENVVTETGWPVLDREGLISLQPEVILQLLSSEPQQVVDQAQRVWRQMPQLLAAREGRVHVINQWYSQQPGFHVGELAEAFARALHPEAQASFRGTGAAHVRSAAHAADACAGRPCHGEFLTIPSLARVWP